MLTLTKCQGALAIPSTGATVTVSNLKHLVKQIVCIPRFKTEHQQDDLPLSGGMWIRRPAVVSASHWRPPRAAAASWGRQVARARRGAASPSGVWSARPAPVAWATQPAPAPVWRSVARSRSTPSPGGVGGAARTSTGVAQRGQEQEARRAEARGLTGASARRRVAAGAARRAGGVARSMARSGRRP